MAGATASTFTVTTVDVLNWRSSNAVARTAMGPAPVLVVSALPGCDWKRASPFAAYVIFTGLLSGLTASQVMEAVSPARRLVGEAEQLILGGVVLVFAASGWGALVNEGWIGAIPARWLCPSLQRRRLPLCLQRGQDHSLALLRCTLRTIMSPRVRRGRLESSPLGSLCGSFCVSS